MTDEQLRKALTPIHGMTPMMRLRWRFDFSDRKLTRWGQWNGAHQRREDMAAFVNKQGLVRAAIECEKVSRWDQRTLAQVDGCDFVSFSWVAACGLPSPLSLHGPATVQGQVMGLTMLCRYDKVTVYIDGQVKVEKLTDYESKHKLEEHGG